MNCLYCNKEFETDDENMLFCSKKCKQGFKKWQIANLGERGFEPFEDCTTLEDKKRETSCGK